MHVLKRVFGKRILERLDHVEKRGAFLLLLGEGSLDRIADGSIGQTVAQKGDECVTAGGTNSRGGTRGIDVADMERAMTSVQPEAPMPRQLAIVEARVGRHGVLERSEVCRKKLTS